MKLRFTFILLLVVEIVSAQNYYLPKTVLQDSLTLRNKLKEYISIQNKDYKAKNDLDSLSVLVKQEIFLDHYAEAINNINFYRDNLAANNWDGTKLFSFEVYSRAKILTNKENLNFTSSLEKVLKEKIESLPESLLIKLKRDIVINISEYKKKKTEALSKLSDKTAINGNQLNSLMISIIDYEVLNAVNEMSLSVLQSKISEKFIIDRVDIKTTNATLSATIIRRRDLKGRQPVILYSNIYAEDSKDHLLGMRAAIRDYIGVVVNSRGKRNSTEKIEPFEHEANDMYDVIDWVSKQEWCNGKVGMTGGSYVGFAQWATLKKPHPALKTIVPQVSVGIGTMDYPMTNNVFMAYMLPWLSYVTNNNLIDQADFDNDVKWASIRNEYYNKGLKFSDLDSLNGKRNPLFQRWLKHPAQDSYWQKMVPYKEEFSKINIPILTLTGYYDGDQRGALYYFNEHNKYNPKAEHYLVIGPYEHLAAQSFPNNEVDGIKLDDTAKINFTDLSYDWFDYILKQKPKPEILKDKINIQIMGTNQWKNFDSMKKTNNKKMKLYLNKELKLVFTKPGKESYFNQTVDFKIRKEAKKYYSTGKDSISIRSAHSVLESDILDKDIIMDGAFTGNLKLSINKKDIDVSIYLFQVKPNGKIISLSDYIGRASYAKNNSKRQLLTPNKVEEIPVRNSVFMGTKIEKGSKFLILFGVNKSKAWQINYGTGKDVSEESIKDAEEPLEIKWYNDSYIQIPVLE